MANQFSEENSPNMGTNRPQSTNSIHSANTSVSPSMDSMNITNNNTTDNLSQNRIYPYTDPSADDSSPEKLNSYNQEEQNQETNNTSTADNTTNESHDDNITTGSTTTGNHATKPNGINKKNRNRISFVCQACRRSKTKCDKEKPSCTRCLKLHIECVYDVAKQPRPRIPNKDATIAKLERDVSYWQNKAMKLLSQQQDTLKSLKSNFPNINNMLNNNNNSNNNSNNTGNSMVYDSDRSSSIGSLSYSVGHRNSSINSGRNTPVFSQMTRDVNNNDDDMLTDIEINLYKDHPTMIFSKVMKHDVKPLSENYIIIQDRFIASCIASAFMSQNSNSMIPALTANANISRAQKSVRNNVGKLKNILMKQCTDPVRRSRIDDFTNRILENTNSSRNLKIGMILSMLYNTVGHQYLEDYCSSSGQYSDLLKSFITEFERLLPPYEIIQSYKKHFYQYVYPSLPFLQTEMFEESISQTVTRDPEDPTKVKLNLGNNHLRDKIENLSILMVILKLSYISLKSIITDDDNEESTVVVAAKLPGEATSPKEKKTRSKKSTPEDNDNFSPMPIFVTQDQANKYPISNDFILIAQRCLASENWFACANENIITCLLFIWSFFAFSPEEGDFFLEHPTDIISSLIMMLATSIGLHRDPDDFAQLKEPSLSDQRLLNHRRLLWVSVVGICSFESTLKGRHPLLSSDLMSSFLDTKTSNSIKQYMERVTRDMTGTEKETLLEIHSCTARRAQLSLLLADLDNLTMSYNDTFALRYLELSREKIEIFMAENFPLKELDKKRSKNTKAYYGDFNPHLNLLANKNANSLQSLLITKLMFLRTSAAIYLHFEVNCLKNPSLLPYYYKYLTQTAIDSLELVKVFNEFFNGKYSNYIYKSNFYNVTKVIQLALPTALFTVIGLIIRLTLTNNNLFRIFQENINNYTFQQKADLNMRFEHTTFIQKELENTLEWMYAFASQNLRFTYFSIFKLFAVADVVLQRIRNGEIWKGIHKIATLKGIHTRITTNLRMTLGVNIEKGAELIDDLEKRNFTEDMPIPDLTKLCRAIHEIHVTLERPTAGISEKEPELYIPPSVKYTLSQKPAYPTVPANMTMNINHGTTINIPNNNQPPPLNGLQRNHSSGNLYPVPLQNSIPIHIPVPAMQYSNLPDQRGNSFSSAQTEVGLRSNPLPVDPNNNFNHRPIAGPPGQNIPAPPHLVGIGSTFTHHPYASNGRSSTSLNTAFYNNPNMNIANNYFPNESGHRSSNNNMQPNSGNNGLNESIAREFMERTKAANLQDQSEFFGGFDLFDYDFLFGNDFA